MCVTSAIAAIVKVMRIDPGHGVHTMTEAQLLEATDVVKQLGAAPAQVRALKGVSLTLARRSVDPADGTVRQRQDHAALHARMHDDADRRHGPGPRPIHQGRRAGASGQAPGATMLDLSFNAITCFRRSPRSTTSGWRWTCAASMARRQRGEGERRACHRRSRAQDEIISERTVGRRAAARRDRARDRRNASIILADEPTAALDSENGHAIMDVLAKIAAGPDARGIGRDT